MNKQITIGLFGFGCVGKGVYETIQKLYSHQIKVKKIGIKNPGKERNAPAGIFTTNWDELIKDPGIDLIVEAIDDASWATRIIARSFEHGKDVVSANKLAIATGLKFFIDLQEDTGRTLLYEAAVAASIPVLRLLEGHYLHEPIQRVEAILNGTTNYLLSKMHLENKTYGEALQEAQQNGYAESDPTLDVAGWDAAYKAVILAAHAFGHIHTPDEVARTTFEDFLEQKPDLGRNYKSITTIQQRDFGTNLDVQFKPVTEKSGFHAVDYEMNAVGIGCAVAGDQFFIGKGAGASPTASAIIADIFQWQKGFRYHYQKYQTTINYLKEQQLALPS